ncbi:MAG TPA: transporter substrate-binding domain-containing protein [Myxococcota bacterium]|nr:transporter substrate-binding domain-containing protein [Myxococcota bacterium]
MRGVLILLLLLSVLSVPTGQASSAQPAPRIVKVGVYQNEPKLYFDRQGVAKGILIDFLQDVADDHGWQVQYVRCSWQECLASLDDGRIDLLPDVAWSAERERLYDFHSTPVLESWSQVYSRSGKNLTGLRDLSGQRVAILDGSIQLDSLARFFDGLDIDVTFVRTHSIAEAFDAVSRGRADVAVANYFFGDHFYRQYDLNKSAIVFQPSWIYFATGKGRNADLLETIETEVFSQRADSGSRYYQILREWTSAVVIPASVPEWVYWAIGIASCLLVLSAGFLLALRAKVRSRTATLKAKNDELVRTQQELVKNAELLRVTQEMALVGGWEWDVGSRRMTFTDETFRLHGLNKADYPVLDSEIIKVSLRMYAPEYREALERAFEACVADGTPWLLDAVFISADGRQMYVRTAGNAVRDDDGRIVRVLGTLMDITRIKTEQDARIRAEEDLRLSRRMGTIGHLTGGIAHDFNNLLSAILGYTGLMQRRGELKGQMLDDVKQIQAAGERAANLTHQLLAFGSRRTTQPRVVSINSIVTGLEKLLHRVLTENITISTELDGEAGNILVDPGQMEQVLINLAVNARDAMPSGGTMTVRTSGRGFEQETLVQGVRIGAGRWTTVAVSDTGTGMDARTMARLFEPFFTTKEVGRGTGLGLATVFAVVREAGGQIVVESEPGRGSVFTVFIPTRELEAVSSEPECGELVTGTGTVLVVEDDDGVRTVAERILAAAGYRVMTAVDGAEALNMCQRHSDEIDLILTDVVMPRMDGGSLADSVAMRYPDIRILFMSGHADLSKASGRRLDPEQNFIAKPFLATELSAAVARVLAADKH